MINRTTLAALAAVTLGLFIASAAMYLAFLPPASYLAFVRSRFATQTS